MSAGLVKISVPRPVYDRLTARRAAFTDARGRQVTIGEVLEQLLQLAELVEASEP